MTALAAVFQRDGRPIDRAALGRVANALKPFGTAKTEPWCDGPAGLVWIAGGCFAPENTLDSQPVPAGGRLLLFDGLLAHRRQLADALGLAPRRAAEDADSALFARAWERWGEDAALRAEGEFAAVVWDPRRRVLVAVCSPLNAPPLYYAVDRRRAIVATTPSAVFAWGDLPRALDDGILASNLINDYGDGRRTCYKGVNSLLPGEALTAAPKAMRVRRYYALAERVRPVRLAKDTDYVDAANELLRDAVASGMRAVETPAISLSGGLDSSAVAVAALDHLADRGDAAPLVSFTATETPGWDGRVKTAEVGDVTHRVPVLARMYPRLDTRFFDVGDLSFERLLQLEQRMIELTELPPRSRSWLRIVYKTAVLVAESGRNVLLNGGGGNNTLSYDGLARLASLLRAGRLPSLLRESAGGPAGTRLGRLSPVLHYGIYRNLPRRLHGAVRRLVYGQRGWVDVCPIHPRFARANRVDERVRENGFDPYYRGRESVRKVMFGRWELHARRHQARAPQRSMQAIAGIQARLPMHDRRLVEWALGIPDEQHLDGGQSRRLMRRMMKARLPPEILTGPRGRSGSDWHLLAARELPEIRATLESWRSEPGVAERIDLERCLRLVDAWPQATPVRRQDHPDHQFIRHGLDHALAAGRFIRWAEGGGNWAAT